MTVEQFDFIVDVSRALIWQYNSAEKIEAMVLNKQKWLDENVRDFWANWYRDVYDLRTANDFGLQVWAIILGMQFALKEDIPTVWFGFTGSGGKNFNNASFFPNNTLALSTEQKRNLLQLRYFQITSGGTIPEINRAVQRILPNAKIIDNMNMTITLAYPDIPSSEAMYILENYDVIPRPAGVKINNVFGYATWFGFTGSGLQNFNNSNFGG